MIALVLIGAVLSQPAAQPAPTTAVFLAKRVGASAARAKGAVDDARQALLAAGVGLLSAEEFSRQAKAAGVADSASCDGKKTCALDLGRKLGLDVVVPVLVGEVQGELSVHVEALLVAEARKLTDETLIVPASALGGLRAKLRPFAERVRAAMPAPPAVKPVVERPVEQPAVAILPEPEVVAPVEAPGADLKVWVPAAAGAALVAGGGVFLVLAKQRSDALTGGSGGPSTLSNDEALAARDTGRRQQTIGLLMAGAGVVALGVAGGLHFYGSGPDPVVAAPFVAPGGGGVVFAGALP